MKIKIFLPNGVVEADGLSVLISMVKSGVVKPETIIEAKGKRVKASDVKELRPLFALDGTKPEEQQEPQAKPQEESKTKPRQKIDAFTVVAFLIAAIILMAGAKFAYSKSVERKALRDSVINEAIDKNILAVFVDNGGLSLFYYKKFWDAVLPSEPKLVSAALSSCPAAEGVWTFPSGSCSRLSLEMAAVFMDFDSSDKATFLAELQKNVDAALKKDDEDQPEAYRDYLASIKERLTTVENLIAKRDSAPFPFAFFFGAMVIPVIASVVVVLVFRILSEKSKNNNAEN